MIVKNIQNKRIFVIEKQPKWREFSGLTLKSAGYRVKIFDKYDKVKFDIHNKPDLVIFAFTKVTEDELTLIKMLHRRHLRQLVLSTFLSWSEMRKIFLAGADDVAEKPFNSQDLLEIVCESFNSISIKDSNKLKEMQVG